MYEMSLQLRVAQTVRYLTVYKIYNPMGMGKKDPTQTCRVYNWYVGSKSSTYEKLVTLQPNGVKAANLGTRMLDNRV